MGEPQRCSWVGGDPIYQAYHDTEWACPSATPGCCGKI
jgi:3-methyladenine DNA glycosylase Tag